ncbi:DMT family transporter [Rivihabitans pingtungensis]|uniref:Drug/metabolite transporter (DMT)-like permease n=1 Tax=Rivihabitans pingtungensis TaxID=1054498 RepID=A0A318LJB9_9NEIS|nr:DMT family transporter [Rivihabitans pingtungensis]PXX81797.1 drug/metabolite transporter (DMT)-like permease [Rivihabitans pingtungensis]
MQTVYIKLFFSALFWGASAIAGKWLFAVLRPAQVTFLRFALAALALGAVVTLARRQPGPASLGEHLRLAVLGVVGVSLCYYFYFEGLYYSSAFNAGLIEATIPLVTLALSVLLKEEHLDSAQTTGFALAYVGVLVIVTRLDWAVIQAFAYNRGDVLLLLGTLCFGLYNVLLRKFRFSFASQNTKLFYIFLYGSAPLAGWVWLDGLGQPLHWTLDIHGWLALVVLALGASVLAYVFFNQGIQAIGASRASSFINLVPVITAGLAFILLGERPDFSQLLGSAVILLGVSLSQYGWPRWLAARVAAAS